MQYDKLVTYNRVKANVPGMRAVEKLEERRLSLSLLTLVCVFFCLSQFFGDHQATLSVRFLGNSLINSFLPLM